MVMNGAGAAGIAAARLLDAAGVRDIIMCDRQGAIYAGREGLNEEKIMAASFTNLDKRAGSLADVAAGADVLIGVSAAGASSGPVGRGLVHRRRDVGRNDAAGDEPPPYRTETSPSWQLTD